MQCLALVVAAGRGERFGGPVPKQYQPLAGKPVLRHAVERLLRHPAITGVRVVVAPEHRSLYEAAVAGLDPLDPVTGGADRQESVRLGLESIASRAPATVLVHDAARPLVPVALIDRVVDALREHAAVLPALPVVDTLKRRAGGRIAGEADRTGLLRAQTPQGFAFAPLLAAHRALAGRGFTDDAAVVAAHGVPVVWVRGEEENMKVTLPEDLVEAERRLAGARRWRTGQGFDVHRLVAGRPLWLCGVHIPFERGLDGHSDADVALHALTDAVLGTIGAGDIGTHFPPSDPRWKDAASDRFLAHALGLLRERGGRLEHLDVTILCERPRIGPHRAAMVTRLRELTGLGEGAVSVKATTTEGLGFTGRGEGVAAQAVATASFWE